MNIKKFLSITLLSTIFMQSSSFARYNYINYFLPLKSLVRQRCNTSLRDLEPKAYESVENALAFYVQENKSSSTETNQEIDKRFLFNEHKLAWARIEHYAALNTIKDPLRKILKDQPDAVKWQEFDLFQEAIIKIKAEKAKKEKQKKLDAQNAVKAEKEANPRGKF